MDSDHQARNSCTEFSSFSETKFKSYNEIPKSRQIMSKIFKNKETVNQEKFKDEIINVNEQVILKNINDLSCNNKIIPNNNSKFDLNANKTEEETIKNKQESNTNTKICKYPTTDIIIIDQNNLNKINQNLNKNNLEAINKRKKKIRHSGCGFFKFLCK